jgi:hypothetical protein
LRDNGKVSGSRKQRVSCALVELRDRIKDEFARVAKDWQVSAQELRRCYSYVYPAAAPGAPDLLCVEHACEDVMMSLRSQIQTYAEQYGVPDDMVEEMLVDRLVSDHMGTERTPVAFFMPETEERSTAGRTGATEKPGDGLPLFKDLLMRMTNKANGTAGASAEETRVES